MLLKKSIKGSLSPNLHALISGNTQHTWLYTSKKKKKKTSMIVCRRKVKKLASKQHNLNVPRLYLGKERCLAKACTTLGGHRGV